MPLANHQKKGTILLSDLADLPVNMFWAKTFEVLYREVK